MRIPGTGLRFSQWGLLLALAASCAPVARAGPGAWMSGGPWGGEIQALAVDPSNPATLYAGTYYGGIFKSIDSGRSWSRASAGLPDSLHVSSLAIDPAFPGTLYAGTLRAGVFRSRDAGGTWVPASAGLTDLQIQALVVDPVTPSTLYVGTLGGGVSRSVDSGETWAPSNAGLQGARVMALSIGPGPPGTLFAGTTGGVFKSTDAGASWIASSTGLTETGHSFVEALASDSGTLYAATSSDGVYRSTDTGDFWTLASNGIPHDPYYPQATALAASRTVRSTVFFAGGYDGDLYRSTDSGESWVPVGTGLRRESIGALALDPVAPTTLYVGMKAGSGVFVSDDAGASCFASSVGLAGMVVYALASDPAVPYTLWAATDGGVFRSVDSGSTWSARDAGFSFSRWVQELHVAPGVPSTLFAVSNERVYRSEDDGASWAIASRGLPPENSEGALRSFLAVSRSVPATLFLGTTDGVYKSTNSGETWAPSSPNLRGVHIAAVTVDPVNPSTVYMASYGGTGAFPRTVFRSTDSGEGWVAQGAMPVTPTVLRVDPTNPSNLYAGSYSEGVVKSTDSGATWAAASFGLPKGRWVYALVVNPANSDVLFAGVEAEGVFRSADGGATWASVGDGLPRMSVQALALDPAGETTLYAGLAGGSVWQATPPPVLGPTSLLLPSSARVGGAGGAFYTTDLTVANLGTTSTAFVLKFLGNNADGRDGAEVSFPIAAGESMGFSDVLDSVFGRKIDYGAVRISSPSGFVLALAQTSTSGFGGTFGQSVPPARPEDLVAGAAPRSILAVREDASFRTNLFLANATEAPLDVDVTFVASAGALRPSASRRVPLPPLGMTQLSSVVRELGVAEDVVGARLVLSTPTADGAFAAYASVIDNVTNDPRTLLPVGPVESAHPLPDTWLLPSSARAEGAGGAFYTTDLTVAWASELGARFTLKFLDHDEDGLEGPEATFDLGAGASVTYGDVLGSVFRRTSAWGAIRVASQSPIAGSTFLGVLGQTSTPGFGGTFGQSVPAATAAELIRPGSERSILAVREDASFRTNLCLANATEADLDVDVRLVSAGGSVLATKRYPLAPLGMTQVTNVVRALGLATDVTGARLVLSTLTENGAFAAYASVIDNVTNDPRTLLPR